MPPTPLHPGQPPCSSVRFHQLSQITPLLKHLKNTPATSHQPRQTLWTPQQGQATSLPSGLEHTNSPAHMGPSTTRTRVPLPPSPHLQALGQSPPPRDLPAPPAPDATVKWKLRGWCPLKTQQGSRAVWENLSWPAGKTPRMSPGAHGFSPIP